MWREVEKGGMCIIRSSVQGSDTLSKKHHSSGYNLNSAIQGFLRLSSVQFSCSVVSDSEDT